MSPDCTLEEGEVWQPELPSGSPPPEDEWAPCVRLLVKESQCVAVGTLFVVTQEGANIGRYVNVYNYVLAQMCVHTCTYLACAIFFGKGHQK